MSGGGIDINDMPYCNSSNSHDDETSKSGYDGFNNIAKY